MVAIHGRWRKDPIEIWAPDVKLERRMLEKQSPLRTIKHDVRIDGMAEGLRHLIDRHERGCLPELSEETVRSFSGRPGGWKG